LPLAPDVARQPQAQLIGALAGRLLPKASQDTGFRSTSTLFRRFRDHLGMTPRQWRQRQRGMLGH